MNDINFGMDGLSLDGTYWHNPKTGDSFMIKSNYFEDNHMIIMTSDGRRFNMDKMKDYIQTKSLVQKTTPQKPVLEDLPPEVASLIGDSNDLDETPTENIEDYLDPEDLAMIQGNQPKALKQDGLQIPVPNTRTKISSNYDIIERALNKTKNPDWVLSMKWPKFPQKELDMLITVMDIPVEDIEQYYLDLIKTEFDDFMSNLKSQIGDYIKKKLKGDEPETKSTYKKSKSR